MTWFVVGLALTAFAAIWILAVRGFYASLPPGAQTFSVPTEDGWALQVHYRPAAPRRYMEPVVLAHGLANNSRVMEFLPGASLAESLAAAGFEVFSMDFRGAGTTVPPQGWDWPTDATVDDYVRLDAPAVVKFACEKAGAERCFWVGHSLGGLVGLALSVERPNALAGLVTVGSPAFFEGHQRRAWMLRLAAASAYEGRLRFDFLFSLIAPLTGWFRLPMVTTFSNLGNFSGQGIRALTAATMASVWRGVVHQLERWVKTGNFSSNDGVDWRARLSDLKHPLLVVGGSVDGLAPAAATEALAKLGPTGHTEVVVLGRATGLERDYGHGDLLTGEHAPQDVFPRITAWLSGRATTLSHTATAGAAHAEVS